MCIYIYITSPIHMIHHYIPVTTIFFGELSINPGLCAAGRWFPTSHRARRSGVAATQAATGEQGRPEKIVFQEWLNRGIQWLIVVYIWGFP